MLVIVMRSQKFYVTAMNDKKEKKTCRSPVSVVAKLFFPIFHYPFPFPSPFSLCFLSSLSPRSA